MKEFFKKITVILMALVVFLSTMSFTISQHYCSGDLMGSAIFSKVHSCSMIENKSTSSCEIDKNCCENVIKQFEGKKIINTAVEQINAPQKIFLASFIYTYINLFEGLDANIIPFKNYTPPLLVSDIHVIDQVFLI